MTERVNLTDGRDVLSVPASASHALAALGWAPTEEPTKKAPPTKPRRRKPKPAALVGVPTNADEPGEKP